MTRRFAFGFLLFRMLDCERAQAVGKHSSAVTRRMRLANGIVKTKYQPP